MLPLLVVAAFSMFITGSLLVLKWLFTGCANDELLWKPMEFVIGLPYKIIE